MTLIITIQWHIVIITLVTVGQPFRINCILHLISDD